MLAARLLDVAANECVVIEDAKNGVKAAKRAGMKIVGLKVPESAQDLSLADVVVESLDEMNVDTLHAMF